VGYILFGLKHFQQAIRQNKQNQSRGFHWYNQVANTVDSDPELNANSCCETSRSALLVNRSHQFVLINTASAVTEYEPFTTWERTPASFSRSGPPFPDRFFQHVIQFIRKKRFKKMMLESRLYAFGSIRFHPVAAHSDGINRVLEFRTPH